MDEVADAEALHRAILAYERSAATRPHSVDHTIALVGLSYIAEHLDRRYVVVDDLDGVAAVYRIRNDGMLKALRRWPAEIEEKRMTITLIASAPNVTTGQVNALSRMLAAVHGGNASADGSHLTARLRIATTSSAFNPVFSRDQAEQAARKYVAKCAEAVLIEGLEITQASIY